MKSLAIFLFISTLAHSVAQEKIFYDTKAITGRDKKLQKVIAQINIETSFNSGQHVLDLNPGPKTQSLKAEFINNQLVLSFKGKTITRQLTNNIATDYIVALNTLLYGEEWVKKNNKMIEKMIAKYQGEYSPPSQYDQASALAQNPNKSKLNDKNQTIQQEINKDSRERNTDSTNSKIASNSPQPNATKDSSTISSISKNPQDKSSASMPATALSPSANASVKQNKLNQTQAENSKLNSSQETPSKPFDQSKFPYQFQASALNSNFKTQQSVVNTTSAYQFLDLAVNYRLEPFKFKNIEVRHQLSLNYLYSYSTYKVPADNLLQLGYSTKSPLIQNKMIILGAKITELPYIFWPGEGQNIRFEKIRNINLIAGQEFHFDSDTTTYRLPITLHLGIKSMDQQLDVKYLALRTDFEFDFNAYTFYSSFEYFTMDVQRASSAISATGTQLALGIKYVF
jgi:hypothetical protein